MASASVIPSVALELVIATLQKDGLIILAQVIFGVLVNLDENANDLVGLLKCHIGSACVIFLHFVNEPVLTLVLCLGASRQSRVAHTC